jgi:hypothetical protein
LNVLGYACHPDEKAKQQDDSSRTEGVGYAKIMMSCG